MSRNKTAVRPLVIDYLKNRSLQELKDKHGVNFRPCKLSKKFSLNYDQLAASKTDELAQQCRGMIISPTFEGEGDHANRKIIDVDVVAWPLNRFFNQGEVTTIESLSGFKLYEKLDGTMCVLYCHEGSWHVATRSVPEADEQMNSGFEPLGYTFSSLFKKALRETLEQEYDEKFKDDDTCFETFTRSLDHGTTYVFELTTPINRIIVKYDTYRVTLLALRDTKTGIERRIEDEDINVPKCKNWDFDSDDVHDLCTFVNESDPAKLEGAVLVDQSFFRIKVKSKAWVVASRGKDIMSASKRNVLECIINENVDDILPFLQEDVVDHILTMQNAFHDCVKEIDAKFKETILKHKSRKEFALEISTFGWPTPYFQLYKEVMSGSENASVMKWLKTLSNKQRLTPGILDSIINQISRQG